MIRSAKVHPYLVLLVLACVLMATQALGEPYDGYTLYSSNGSYSTYLLDMDDNVAYSWNHGVSGGYAAYLLEDGSVIRPAESNNSNMNGGAAAGIVIQTDHNGSEVWEYWYSSNSYRSHHDIEPMPNGNVLLIAWERKSSSEAVAAGLDHTAEIWPDHLVEIQPTGPTSGEIVWEWHFWDHLIQDHDPTKANYGVVADHPELLDINLGGGGFGGDWNHINGISYNPELDQIVISSHNMDEIYVIDHSTTTEEAAGHTGGNAGMGGDILYRWGNPSAYGVSGTHYLDVVHCSVWIPEGYPGAGNIMAYNNRDGQGSSQVIEIVPPHDGTYNYYLEPGEAYGPTSPVWSFSDSWFYSNHLGGCQRLPNGNTIVVESTSGDIYEVDVDGDVQWQSLHGGQIPRALRYGNTYAGLAAIGLATDVDQVEGALGSVTLMQNYPNPFNPQTTISYALHSAAQVKLEVFDDRGRSVRTLVDETQGIGDHAVVFDATGLASGVYLYQIAIDGVATAKKLTILK